MLAMASTCHTLRASLLPGATAKLSIAKARQQDLFPICQPFERHTCPHHPVIRMHRFSVASSSYWCRRTSGPNILAIDSLRAKQFKLDSHVMGYGIMHG